MTSSAARLLSKVEEGEGKGGEGGPPTLCFFFFLQIEHFKR